MLLQCDDYDREKAPTISSSLLCSEVCGFGETSHTTPQPNMSQKYSRHSVIFLTILPSIVKKSRGSSLAARESVRFTGVLGALLVLGRKVHDVVLHGVLIVSPTNSL